MYTVSGISIALGRRTILEGISLDLEPGTVTALIGPNGAGKSTLLRVLAGEIKPAAGAVRIGGDDLAALSPRALAARRAVLPQSVTLAFAFTVAEVVALGISAAAGPARRAELVRRALAAVDLAAFADRDCMTLSGGEQQRAQFARVLAQVWSSPDEGRNTAILLDEPTASLDLSHQLLVLRLARRHAEAGGTVLAVLHDLNLAALVADRIVALGGGRIIADGPAATTIGPQLLARLYGLDETTASIFLPRPVPAGAMAPP